MFAVLAGLSMATSLPMSQRGVTASRPAAAQASTTERNRQACTKPLEICFIKQNVPRRATLPQPQAEPSQQASDAQVLARVILQCPSPRLLQQLELYAHSSGRYKDDLKEDIEAMEKGVTDPLDVQSIDALCNSLNKFPTEVIAQALDLAARDNNLVHFDRTRPIPANPMSGVFQRDWGQLELFDYLLSGVFAFPNDATWDRLANGSLHLHSVKNGTVGLMIGVEPGAIWRDVAKKYPRRRASPKYTFSARWPIANRLCKFGRSRHCPPRAQVNIGQQ
jgi:hypothetical protein